MPSRSWRRRNPERAREQSRRQRFLHPEMNRNYYLKNRESLLTRQKKYSARLYSGLRGKILARYGAWCVCCGENEPGFLTIDHVGGGGRKERQKASGLTILKRVLSDTSGRYRVLCMNCNWAMRHTHVCPHQDGGVRERTWKESERRSGENSSQSSVEVPQISLLLS